MRAAAIAAALTGALAAAAMHLPVHSADREVIIGDNWFCAADYVSQACSVEAAAGETLTWRSTGSIVHNVKECGVSCDSPTGSPAFASPFISPGSTYSYTLNDPGTFNFYCSIHPTMRGVLTVSAGPPPTSAATAPPATEAPPPPTQAPPPPATEAATPQVSPTSAVSPSTGANPSATVTAQTRAPRKSTLPVGSPSPTVAAGSSDAGGGPAVALVIVARLGGLAAAAGAAVAVVYLRSRHKAK